MSRVEPPYPRVILWIWLTISDGAVEIVNESPNFIILLHLQTHIPWPQDNVTVNLSFDVWIPDVEREAEENRKRQKLKDEWTDAQERLKSALDR